VGRKFSVDGSDGGETEGGELDSGGEVIVDGIVIG
jgi:hypothetical protein